jgi:hypothetical protein
VGGVTYHHKPQPSEVERSLAAIPVRHPTARQQCPHLLSRDLPRDVRERDDLTDILARSAGRPVMVEGGIRGRHSRWTLHPSVLDPPRCRVIYSPHVGFRALTPPEVWSPNCLIKPALVMMLPPAPSYCFQQITPGNIGGLASNPSHMYPLYTARETSTALLNTHRVRGMDSSSHRDLWRPS